MKVLIDNGHGIETPVLADLQSASSYYKDLQSA